MVRSKLYNLFSTSIIYLFAINIAIKFSVYFVIFLYGALCLFIRDIILYQTVDLLLYIVISNR